jgi:RNA polymerase sigma factor (sigma-70 family)
MTNPSYQGNIPRLPERQNYTDEFCTYLMVNTSKNAQIIEWQNQNRLRTNFNLYQQHNPEFAQLCSQPNHSKNLALYWKKIAIDSASIPQEWEPKNRQKLALEHLVCYLEKNCYYAAKEVSKNSQEEPWDEYLSSARIFIYKPKNLCHVLQSYDCDQASLNTYIQAALIQYIRDQMSVGKFSPWRLLVEKSEKELRKALENSAIQESTITKCIFASKYFKKVYRLNKVYNPAVRKRGEKWHNADTEDFWQATEYYNAEKALSNAPHEVSAGSNINQEQMQAWMEFCIKALQNYQNPINNKISWESHQEKGDENLSQSDTEEFFDIEADENTEENGRKSQQIHSVFRKQIEEFKPDQHKTLLLYYGCGIKQTQLEIKLGISQSAISRRLNTIKTKLIKTMAEMSQPEAWPEKYVLQWLHKNFRDPLHSDLIHAALVEAVKKLESQEKTVFHLHYGQELNVERIAIMLSMNNLEVNAILSKSQQHLQSKLIAKLENWERDYVEKWLLRFYQSQVRAVCRSRNLSLQAEDASQTVDVIVDECLQILISANKGE